MSKIVDIVSDIVSSSHVYNPAEKTHIEITMLKDKLAAVKGDALLEGMLSEKIAVAMLELDKKKTVPQVRGEFMADLLTSLPSSFFGTATRIVLQRDSSGKKWLYSAIGTAKPDPVAGGLTLAEVCQYYGIPAVKGKETNVLATYAKVMGKKVEDLVTAAELVAVKVVNIEAAKKAA